MRHCPPRTGTVLARGKLRALQKMKNSGNEAKKWLKTKDITFLICANCVRFACKTTQIMPPMEQKHRVSLKTKLSLNCRRTRPGKRQTVGYTRVPLRAPLLRQQHSISTTEPGRCKGGSRTAPTSAEIPRFLGSDGPIQIGPEIGLRCAQNDKPTDD
jgi:hypothetical protein